ncbi:MAG: class I SAM-dependent methyltransferase [Aphanizomenon gracile PMC627.10]|nr:class I SAM-dependent methyltransferase [Aphanizomenon gracile PMC627.10]
MNVFKQGLRDFVATQVASVLKRFAFDPRYFDLWQSHGFHVKPVHFYSPFPNTQSLPDELWSKKFECPGIIWNESSQLQFLAEFSQRYRQEYEKFPQTKPTGKPRFYFGNLSFESVDAVILYCMIRYFYPHNVVEIGSGYSTLLAAEALSKNLGDGYLGKLTAIEPYPPSFLKEELPFVVELLNQPVQSVPLDFFTTLAANDILVIDSSHVCKVGSDVQYEFLEILPRLAPGVIIHIHDIFLPLEYPENWIKEQHRFWNEQYLLQAFLSFNPAFEILWAGRYMHLHHSPKLATAFNCCYRADLGFGCSFWIRRI